MRAIMVIVLAVIGLASCSLPSGFRHGLDEPTPRFIEDRHRDWVLLDRQKSVLAAQSYEQQVFEVPGHGQVTVRWWALEGGPGWEYVRTRFTYLNTTDRNMDSVEVVLLVRDNDGHQSKAGGVRLVHPLGYSLKPNTLFADEVSVDTGGLHRNLSGWHWTIDIRARQAAEYLSKSR